MQRARDWATHAGTHLAVLMCALSHTEAALASASKSLEVEFARSDLFLSAYEEVTSILRRLNTAYGTSPFPSDEWEAAWTEARRVLGEAE